MAKRPAIDHLLTISRNAFRVERQSSLDIPRLPHRYTLANHATDIAIDRRRSILL